MTNTQDGLEVSIICRRKDIAACLEFFQAHGSRVMDIPVPLERDDNPTDETLYAILITGYPGYQGTRAVGWGFRSKEMTSIVEIKDQHWSHRPQMKISVYDPSTGRGARVSGAVHCDDQACEGYDPAYASVTREHRGEMFPWSEVTR